MNRKIAVAAIVGGLMHAMSVLRGQEVPRVSRERPRLPAVEPPPGAGAATLTPAAVDDLQRQINDLAARVVALEQAQANSVGFSKVGNDLVLQPPSGNVKIKGPQGVTIEGASTVQISAGAAMNLNAAAVMEQKAAMIRLN